MKCANCGLINPESAERCDCGYDFATRTIKASYLPVQQTPSRRRWIVILIPAGIFIAIGPLVGYFSMLVVPTIINDGFTALDWQMVAFLYPAYIFGAIPALCTGIVYGMVSLIFPRKTLRSFFWRPLLGGMIGFISTMIFCELSELSAVLALHAGLPAGVICSLVPQNIRRFRRGSRSQKM